MKPSQYIAKQLHAPTGFLGRELLTRLWNRRNAALNDLTLTCLNIQPDDRILEVGFGGGYLLEHLISLAPDGWLAGVDISSEMVTFCRRRFRSLIQADKLEIHQAVAENLPFPAAHFTKVCSVNSIFYWQDAPKAISEFWRVLAEGGALVLCFTNPEGFQDRQFAQHGLSLYDGDKVLTLLTAAGFTDIELVPGEDKHRPFTCAVGIKATIQ